MASLIFYCNFISVYLNNFQVIGKREPLTHFNFSIPLFFNLFLLLHFGEYQIRHIFFVFIIHLLLSKPFKIEILDRKLEIFIIVAFLHFLVHYICVVVEFDSNKLNILFLKFDHQIFNHSVIRRTIWIIIIITIYIVILSAMSRSICNKKDKFLLRLPIKV